MTKKKIFTLSVVVIVALGIFVFIFLFFRLNKIAPPAPPALPAKPAAGIIISTDKKNYSAGETIIILIENNLEKNIFYSSGGDRVWEIEYLADGEWKKFAYDGREGFQLTGEHLGNDCYIALYEQVPPEALKSQSKISSAWDQKICPFGKDGFSEASVVRNIESGEYRLAFQFGFSLHDNDQLLFEPETIYSDTFIIN